MSAPRTTTDGRRPRLDALAVALLLAFAGVVWAFAEGFTRPAAGPPQWLGDALGFSGAALWAATTLVTRATRLSTALPEKTLLYQLAVSGAALLAASALTGEAVPASIGTAAAAALAFQVVVVTFASYLTWFWLIRQYPATQVSAFTLLTPVFGLLAGVLLLAEPLTTRPAAQGHARLAALAPAPGRPWRATATLRRHRPRRPQASPPEARICSRSRR